MFMPKVSILIAARDEEENLPTLLKSIERLKKEGIDLEILFGNDASNDKTAEILDGFVSKNNYAQVFHLEEKSIEEKLQGKTRVLEKLLSEAKGDFYFFTDADVELPVNWIFAMLQHFSGNVGVIVGLSTMPNDSVISALQGLEWLSAIHFMHLLSEYKVETTGMGNNMVVSKEAYWSTGGYENIPFSIVEDYALYKAIIDNGYDFKQTFEPDLLAYTKPPERFFEQRKRWMKGAFETGSLLIIPALLQAIFLPIIIFICFWNFTFAFWIILNLVVLHFIQIGFIQAKLKLRGYLRFVPLFVLYLPIAWFLQLVNYFLKGDVIWKGRKY